MKQLKAVIIDDEYSARNVLSNLLKLSFPAIEIVATAENLLDGVEAIKTQEPDLVFLDVEMPNFAGYEIARFFEEINFHIIFITAYNQYAIKAFEVNAIDYLLKPIDRKKLALAIEKVYEKEKEKKVLADYNQLLNNLKTKESQTISLTEAGNKYLINVSSIIAICAQGAYSEVYFDDKKILVSKNIGTLAKELEEQKCFIRTHKSWIINQSHILSYQRGSLTIQLTNEIIAKVSRNQKESFEACL